MWDGCVLGVLLIKCSVAWCLSRNCVKDHPGLNPTHTMCSLIFGHQEERNLKLQTIIDCSAYHQLSDFPQGHTQIRGNSDSIIRIIWKDPFSPYIWWGIVSTNNRFSAEVLLQVVSKTPSVSWSYAILSRVCVPSGVLPIFSFAKLGKKTAC